MNEIKIITHDFVIYFWFCRPEHINNQKQQRGNNEYRGPKPGLLKRSRMLNTSEYGDGLEPIKKSKK